jgi:hypothetical protein
MEEKQGNESSPVLQNVLIGCANVENEAKSNLDDVPIILDLFDPSLFATRETMVKRL